jgi:hypothetical protein
MSGTIACTIALAAIAQLPVTDEEGLVEDRGHVDGEVGLDYLRSSSSQEGPPEIVGEPASTAVQEAGMRVRLHADTFDERLRFDLDYQGREPLGGTFETTPLRILYRAELAFELAPDLITVRLGRFAPHSVALLIVDAVAVDVRGGPVLFSAFFGRRAINTSRRGIGLGTFLPAGGLSASLRGERVTAEVAATISEDELLLAGRDDGDATRAASGFARATARPIDELILGAELAIAERAGYFLGPTWSEASVEAQAFDFWSTGFFADWRPTREVSLGYALHAQRTGLFRVGFLGTPAIGAPPGFDPRFTDNRLHAGLRVLDRGWIRADGRLRHRSDRNEWRGGASIEADDLDLGGLYARASLSYEDVVFEDDGRPHPDLDRALWSIAAGWRADLGLEAEIGASFIDRADTPISSRRFQRAAPGEPSSPEDLAPFVLEAERIVFARAFYAGDVWFGGLDLEQSLEDTGELRLLVQLGALLEAAW